MFPLDIIPTIGPPFHAPPLVQLQTEHIGELHRQYHCDFLHQDNSASQSPIGNGSYDQMLSTLYVEIEFRMKQQACPWLLFWYCQGGMLSEPYQSSVVVRSMLFHLIFIRY